MKEKSRIDWKVGNVAIVRIGWDRVGQTFNVLGPAVFLKQWWVPVEDPDEEDPTFHKESGLDLFEPGKSYTPTSLRQDVEKENISRETAYGIGQLGEREGEIGMWNGPNPSLMAMLETPGQDNNSIVIRFASDGTDTIIYRWHSEENCWRRINGEELRKLDADEFR